MTRTKQLSLIVYSDPSSLFLPNRNSVKPLVPSNYFFVISQCGSVPCREPKDTLAFIFPNTHFHDNCLMVSTAAYMFTCHHRDWKMWQFISCSFEKSYVTSLTLITYTYLKFFTERCYKPIMVHESYTEVLFFCAQIG